MTRGAVAVLFAALALAGCSSGGSTTAAPSPACKAAVIKTDTLVRVAHALGGIPGKTFYDSYAADVASARRLCPPGTKVLQLAEIP